MSSSVIVRLNVEGGPDLELTSEQARDLWEQLNTLFFVRDPSDPTGPGTRGPGRVGDLRASDL